MHGWASYRAISWITPGLSTPAHPFQWCLFSKLEASRSAVLDGIHNYLNKCVSLLFLTVHLKLIFSSAPLSFSVQWTVHTRPHAIGGEVWSTKALVELGSGGDCLSYTGCWGERSYQHEVKFLATMKLSTLLWDFLLDQCWASENKNYEVKLTVFQLSWRRDQRLNELSAECRV